MGTIAHAFESGEQSAKGGIFSNLVTLTRIDGKVDESEKLMLVRVAQKLSLTKEQAKEIKEKGFAEIKAKRNIVICNTDNMVISIQIRQHIIDYIIKNSDKFINKLFDSLDIDNNGKIQKHVFTENFVINILKTCDLGELLKYAKDNKICSSLQKKKDKNDEKIKKLEKMAAEIKAEKDEIIAMRPRDYRNKRCCVIL